MSQKYKNSRILRFLQKKKKCLGCMTKEILNYNNSSWKKTSIGSPGLTIVNLYRLHSYFSLHFLLDPYSF